MKHIENNWKSYEAEALPEGLPEFALWLLRNAFFAGATTTAALFRATDEESEAEVVQRIRDITDEALEFRDSIRRAAAEARQQLSMIPGNGNGNGNGTVH